MIGKPKGFIRNWDKRNVYMGVRMNQRCLQSGTKESKDCWVQENVQ